MNVNAIDNIYDKYSGTSHIETEKHKAAMEELLSESTEEFDDNQDVLSVAYELLESEEELTNSAISSFNNINFYIDMEEHKDNLGEKLLGVEGYYSSDHFSLEGFGDFIKKVATGIAIAFKKLFQAIGNKLKAFKNLFIKGVAKEQIETVKEYTEDDAKIWNKNSKTAEIVSYRYIESLRNPISAVANKTSEIANSIRNSHQDIKKRAAEINSAIKMFASERKTKHVAQIERIMNETSISVGQKLIPIFNSVVKDYSLYSDFSGLQELNVVDKKALKISLEKMKKILSKLSSKTLALSIVVNNKSKTPVQKETYKVIEVFKNYVQAKGFVISPEFRATIDKLMAKTTPPMKAIMNDYNNDVKKYQNAIATTKGVGGIVAKRYVKELFSIDNVIATLALALIASLGSLASNLYVYMLIRNKTFIQAMEACRNVENK